MPSTSTRAACVRVVLRSALELRELRVVDLEVAPDLLYVVEVLERLDQLEQLCDTLAGDGDSAPGHHRQLGFRRLETACLQRTLHGMERRGIGGHHVDVVVATEVLGTGFQRCLERGI